MKLEGDFPRFPLESPEAVARAVGLTLPELEELLESAPGRYRRHLEKKTSGGWRICWAPPEDLKATQRSLAAIFRDLERSPIAYGTRKGRSHTDAAKRHERQAWVAKFDIKDFYPSISAAHVRSLFSRMGCAPDVTALLIAIVTVCDRLNQGPPTSPAVADLLLTGLDHRLHEAARASGVTITRYADDFSISGQDRAAVVRVAENAEEEIETLGLRENRRKRALQPRLARQIVHGLTLNNGASIPKRRAPELGRKTRKAIRDDVRRAGRYGCTQTEWNKLQARVGNIARLHPRRAAQLQATLRNIRILPDPAPAPPTRQSCERGHARQLHRVRELAAAATGSSRIGRR